jgi:hypothetical protein
MTPIFVVSRSVRDGYGAWALRVNSGAEGELMRISFARLDADR